MFKHIVLWLMMIALPVQGFATVNAAHCEESKHPASHQESVSVSHTHVTMVSDMASDTHATADKHDADHSQSSDTSCHASCSMMVSTTMVSPTLPPAVTFTQSYTINPLTAFLDIPQRPPRTRA